MAAPAEVAKLRNFVAWLINAKWMSTTTVTAFAIACGLIQTSSGERTDGKLLKVMVAPMIESLDGRVNITTAATWCKTDASGGYEPLTGFGFPRGNVFLSQGNGYGPAEISFASMLQNPNLPFASISLTIFDLSLINATGETTFLVNWKRSSRARCWNENNEMFIVITSIRLTQYEKSRTSVISPRCIGMGLDRFGNPLLLNNRYQVLNPPSEVREDPYEIRPRAVSVGDQPHTFGELERLIRRFDSSYSSLPSRLQKSLQIDRNYSVNSEINRLLTNRSAELRYPGMGAVATATSLDANGNEFLMVAPGNMLGWVKL